MGVLFTLSYYCRVSCVNAYAGNVDAIDASMIV